MATVLGSLSVDQHVHLLRDALWCSWRRLRRPRSGPRHTLGRRRHQVRQRGSAHQLVPLLLLGGGSGDGGGDGRGGDGGSGCGGGCPVMSVAAAGVLRLVSVNLLLYCTTYLASYWHAQIWMLSSYDAAIPYDLCCAVEPLSISIPRTTWDIR